MTRLSLAALVLILSVSGCTLSPTSETVVAIATPISPEVTSVTATPTSTATPTPTSTPTPAPAPIGEVGQITDTLTHVPQTVVLGHHYANPVVFAQPLSDDGRDTAVVRLTDVEADRFALYVQEAPGEGAGHARESVSYLVLEAGSWELPDGTMLEVGKLTTDATVGGRLTNTWERVNFNLTFSAAPVVISQVQTEDVPHWVKTRQSNVTATGFDVALEEEEKKDAPHGSETIGWLAIEAGQGDWNGHAYEAGQTSIAVTHDWYQITFGQSFGQAPRFVAILMTHNEEDSAHLRYEHHSLTASGVRVRIEEDITWDSETNHLSEAVGYLALEGDGTLMGREK